MSRKACERCGDLGLLCEKHPLEQFQHDDCNEPGMVCPRCVYPFGVFTPERRDAPPSPQSNVVNMREWQRGRRRAG